MVIKKTFGEKVFDAHNYLFLAFLMIITVYPFVYVALSSISRPSELAAHTGILLIPQGFSLEAYKSVLKNPLIISGYRNTLFVVTSGTVLNIIMTSIGAYLLSRKNYYWKKAITWFIVITMFIHGGLIPTYLLVKSIGLRGSLWALIIPGLISTWNLIIMRTSFQSIPDSLEESARIDGANDMVILFRIIIPLSLPVIAVMVLYYGIGHWNAWFSAMIYLSKRAMYPLQLILREILIVNSTDAMMTDVGSTDKESVSETIKYATIMVATLPVLVVYPFLQKYFVKGVMIGAVKG